MSDKAVVKQQTTALAQPGETWAKVRALGATIPESDSDEDIGEVIAARILAAETLDDLLTPSSAPSLGHLVDKPIVIVDIRRRQGGMNKDLGFFLLCAVEDQATGKQEVYSTGAGNVVTQLARAWELGEIPLRCKVLEMESKSNPGQFVQWLVKLDNF
jgi:hypothetical protein